MDCAFLAKITKVDLKMGPLLPCFRVEWQGEGNYEQNSPSSLSPLKMALKSWATSQNLKLAFFQLQDGPNSKTTTTIKIEDL